MMLLAGVLAALVLGLGVWSMMPERTTDVTPATSVTQVQTARTLELSSADVDWQATQLAIAMIKSGKIPPAAAAVAVSPSGGASSTQHDTGTVSTPAAAPVTQISSPTASQPRAIRPVRRVVRTPKPAAAVPAAVQTAPSTPDPATDPPPADLQAAVADIVAQATPETRQAIVEGKTMIYKVHVLDNAFEDGDQVEIFVNGQSKGVVSLTNAGKDIELEFTPGTTVDFRTVATTDGGGGVTFGASTATGETRSRVMQVSESDLWQLTVK
jgi:hypothetical protein